MSSGRHVALANNYAVAPSSAKVPMFLQKLYKIVSDPSTNDVICWSDTGDSFFIHDHERLAKEHLGHWFKHNKFASFVRQLNMYGFHKIPHLQQGVLRSDSDAEHSQFAHPDFHRGQEHRLMFIERKKQPGNNKDSSALDLSLGTNPTNTPQTSSAPAQQLDWHSIVNGINAIRRHQTNISNELAELKRSNQILWQESMETREHHRRQQDTINRIIKFLAGVFGQQVSNSPREKDDARSSPHPVVPGGRLMIEGRRQGGKVEITEVQDEESPRDLRGESPGPYMVETPSTAISRPLSRANSEAGTPILKDVPAFPTSSLLETRSSVMDASPTAASGRKNPNVNANTSIISTQPRYPAADGTHESLNGQSLPVPSPHSPPFDVKFQNALSQLSVSDFQQLFASLSSANTSTESSVIHGLQGQDHLQPSSSQITPYKNPFDFGPLSPKGSQPGNDSLIPLEDTPYQSEQSWKVAGDIEKEVHALNSGIDSLIENLGLSPAILGDPNSLEGVGATDPHADPTSLLNSGGLATDASINTSEQGADEFFGSYLYDPSLDFTVPNAAVTPSAHPVVPASTSPTTTTTNTTFLGTSQAGSPTETISPKGQKRPNPNEVAMKLHLPPNPRAKKQKR